MRIYKYIGLANNKAKKIACITNGYIRYSPLSNFNDKFEGFWVNRFYNSMVEINQQKISELKRKLQTSFITSFDIMRLEGQLLGEFSPRHFPGIFQNISESDLEYYKNIYIHDLEEMIQEETKTIGVLSLTALLNSQLMWAHYADSGNGVIMEFDSNHSYFKNNLFKVKYSDRRVSSKTLTMRWKDHVNFEKREEILEWIIKNLAVKSKPWKYEKEYRKYKNIDDFCKHSNEDLLLEKIPNEAYRAVYYGPELNENDESDLQHQFSKNSRLNVKVFKVIKSEKRYKYDIYQL